MLHMLITTSSDITASRLIDTYGTYISLVKAKTMNGSRNR